MCFTKSTAVHDYIKILLKSTGAFAGSMTLDGAANDTEARKTKARDRIRRTFILSCETDTVLHLEIRTYGDKIRR